MPSDLPPLPVHVDPLPYEARLEARPLSQVDLVVIHCTELPDLAMARTGERGLPLILGGDHALAMGSVSGMARHAADENRPLFVLWLDAHADFNTSEVTPSGNVHGMPVACLCGYGPKELIEIGGQVPAMNPKWIRQIGIRSVDEGERRLIRQYGIDVYDMRYIDEAGMKRTMEAALQGMSADTHLHVS